MTEVLLMRSKKAAVTGFVLALMVLCCANMVLAQSACEIPQDLSVIIMDAKWDFDINTGRLSGEGTIKNISENDVVAPGLSVGIFGVTGELINSVAQRGSVVRLAPGKTVKVKFHIDLKEAPATVMFTTFEGMAST